MLMWTALKIVTISTIYVYGGRNRQCCHQNLHWRGSNGYIEHWSHGTFPWHSRLLSGEGASCNWYVSGWGNGWLAGVSEMIFFTSFSVPLLRLGT